MTHHPHPINWTEVSRRIDEIGDAMGGCQRAIARAMTAALKWAAAPEADLPPMGPLWSPSKESAHHRAWSHKTNLNPITGKRFDGTTFTSHEDRLGRHWTKLRRAVQNLSASLSREPYAMDLNALRDAKAAAEAVLAFTAKLGLRPDATHAPVDVDHEGVKVRLDVMGSGHC